MYTVNGNEVNILLKKKLVQLRGNRTQEEVAKSLGLNRASYSHYETGRYEPNLEMLNKMADYFDVSLDYLLNRSDEPKNNDELEPDIRMISRAAQRMNTENREKMLKILRLTFEEEFEEEDD